MAILRATTNFHGRGSSALEIHPNSPQTRELVDTYVVRMWVVDELIYEQTHSVRDWQMRHFYVEEIARACCSARLLIDQKLFAPSDIGGNQQTTFLSRVHAYLSTDWLTIYLSGAITKRHGELISVDVFGQISESIINRDNSQLAKDWGSYQQLVGIQLSCHPEDTLAFGTKLLSEIADVEQQRIALGIPKYDDPAYGEPVVSD